MPTSLTFIQGYNEIGRLVIYRALHWVRQLNQKLGTQLVPDTKKARGVLKRFVFLELVNVGIEISDSAFVEFNKLFAIVCDYTCKRFYLLDNAVANSPEELLKEFDNYQHTIGAKILVRMPGDPNFGDSLVGKHALQVCRFLGNALDSKTGELVTAASIGAVDASERMSMYLRILDQVDPSDPNVRKGPERFPNRPHPG